MRRLGVLVVLTFAGLPAGAVDGVLPSPKPGDRILSYRVTEFRGSFTVDYVSLRPPSACPPCRREGTSVFRFRRADSRTRKSGGGLLLRRGQGFRGGRGYFEIFGRGSRRTKARSHNLAGTRSCDDTQRTEPGHPPLWRIDLVARRGRVNTGLPRERYFWPEPGALACDPPRDAELREDGALRLREGFRLRQLKRRSFVCASR